MFKIFDQCDGVFKIFYKGNKHQSLYPDSSETIKKFKTSVAMHNTNVEYYTQQFLKKQMRSEKQKRSEKTSWKQPNKTQDIEGLQ